MAKNSVKKKNIRLRRRIRRTLGSICLITAILLAAIPVPEARAAAATEKFVWKATDSKIPEFKQDYNQIYNTGDGQFQFAFTYDNGEPVAVILGYAGSTLEANRLMIPDTVDAYTLYKVNEGGGRGYVAVSRDRKPLFYEQSPRKEVTDVSGNVTVTHAVYAPCYYRDYTNWGHLALDQFYYETPSGSYEDADGNHFERTDTAEKQWIRTITVKYIGNQSLMANPNINIETATGLIQEWVIAEGAAGGNTTTVPGRGSGILLNAEPLNGVFAGETNIVELIVGEQLVGIGNYAFYNCTNLRSITLGNGLEEIGHSAFENCVNMTHIGLDFTSRVNTIWNNTFRNCRALTSFVLPSAVTKIADHAFDGCTGLTDLDLSGAGQNKNVTLAQIGYFVFRGCSQLKGVTLPNSITSGQDTVHLNNFEGCTNLMRITSQGPYITYVADTADSDTDVDSFTVKRFLENVDPKFYFEGADISETHEFTKENAIAFKYEGQELYEIINRIETPSRVDITYRVNNQNQLVYFNMTGAVEEIVIPETIGPYGISAINSGSFANNCFLKKITIPASVTSINDGAFKGCHNLEAVMFTNAANVTNIGAEAFATQVVVNGVHNEKCPNKDFLDSSSASFVRTPKLTFTGAVGNDIGPFNYAMNASSTINAGEQTQTYITYYSGWPTNLEIRYEKDMETGEGAATLVDYPVYSELNGGVYTTAKYPYITPAYEEAAREAISKYEQYQNGQNVAISDYEWDIINAALRVSVPSGVKAITPGLFSGVIGVKDDDGAYTVEPVKGQKKDEYVQQVTFADIAEYKPYTFSGCSSLSQITITGGEAEIGDYAFAYEYILPASVSGGDGEGSESKLTTINMTGGGGKIGDYAFANNPELTNVTLSSTVSSMGLRPFKSCPKLEEVNFSGGPYFTTEQAIIYSLNDGSKDTIIQCLESRGKLNTPGSINSSELAGVKAIAPEAFMNCGDIGQVDLSGAAITSVPESAFRNTGSLYSVTLPTTTRSISRYAFHDSNLRYIDIPGSVSYIDPLAFNTNINPKSDGTYNAIEFYCEPDSAAAIYAGEYENIRITDRPDSTTFKVVFWNGADILDTQEVPRGQSAVAPPDPVREGYKFIGWLPSNFTEVSRDMDVVAQWEKIDSADTKFKVEYIDYNDKVIYTFMAAPGENAPAIVPPARDGYTFTGWRPALTNIQSDTKTYAQYERGTGGNSGGNNNGNNNNGNNNNGNNGGNGTVSGGNGTVSGGNGTATLYTLTVRNGSGSGSYAAGATVIIVANNPPASQRFSKWTTDSSAVKFASSDVSATTIVMPAANTTVTANFVAGSNNGSNGGSNSGTNNRPSTSGGNGTNNGNSGGTTVVIDKNGLSNTGVVSVTIKGSSDNFVVKITEDTEATEAAIRALIEEYGSLDNVKYFPMDISLYDSTGKTKITDTSGLKIDITLPLPDSLITYAGNNKVAGVVNDRLDKLSPKFTTIDGVACVTFTAEHFSPYVIYVKTDNLESTGVPDSSPKTGDIHPKWFAVIALCSISVILFVKKDKTGKRVMVKA